MNRTDRGFTLLELVVVIVALMVMVALAAPFIVRAREASRAESCLNNQRIIGDALLEYEMFFHALPIGGLKDEKDARSLGVMTRILPLLDEKAIADEVDWNASLASNVDQQLNAITAPPGFHCPADDYALGDKRSINYVVNAGSDAAMLGADSAKPEFLGAFDDGDSTTTTDFADGAANTALFSERLVGSSAMNNLQADQSQEKGRAPRDYADIAGIYYVVTGSPDLFVKACADVKADHRGWLTTLGRNWLASYHYVHVLTPNSKITDCGHVAPAPEGIISARSYHPGFVQLTFADGRNESISDQIDQTIWRSFGTRSGHDGAPKP